MKLFCPGPVMVTPKVKEALANCEIGHRSKMFENILNDLRQKALKLTNANEDYEAVFLSASGSAVNEAVISSVFTKKERVLILSNGVFGKRVQTLMKTYQLNFDVYEEKWGELFDLQTIENILKNNDYTYVFLTHHETSCGLINELDKIGKLCSKYNAKLFVDAVSSFGGETVDMVSDNVDILTSVSGKCVGSTPGVSFVVMKKAIFESLKKREIPNSYLNLSKYYEFLITKNQTPNTPSVSAFNALNIAFDECLETFKGDIYLQLSNYIRDELEKLGVEFLIPRNMMSNTVTSIVASHTIYHKLYDKGYITYLGSSEYNKQVVQIVVMGNLTLDDCKEFIEIFKEIYCSEMV